jgi:hypothetical protein
MKEYDIYVTSLQNDGIPVPGIVKDQVKTSLNNAFGGFIELKPPCEGEWHMGGVTFREAVTIFRVLDDGENGLDMANFKRNLECVLKQERVLIVGRDVMVVEG